MYAKSHNLLVWPRFSCSEIVPVTYNKFLLLCNSFSSEMTSYGSQAVLTARPSTIALSHLHISMNLASDCDSIVSVLWACFCCVYSQGLPPNLHHLLCIPIPAVNCFAGYVKISVPEGGQGSLKSYVLLLPCVGCLIIGSDSWSFTGV